MKTFNKIFLTSQKEREMMMVQTKKFHLEEGGKNVYVCKKERRLLFSLKISHISVSRSILPGMWKMSPWVAGLG